MSRAVFGLGTQRAVGKAFEQLPEGPKTFFVRLRHLVGVTERVQGVLKVFTAGIISGQPLQVSSSVGKIAVAQERLTGPVQGGFAPTALRAWLDQRLKRPDRFSVALGFNVAPAQEVLCVRAQRLRELALQSIL